MTTPQPAPVSRRIWAMIIDCVSMVIVFFILLLFQASYTTTLTLPDPSTSDLPTSHISNPALYYTLTALSILIPLAYFLLPEKLWAATPGKLLLGLKVTSSSHTPLTWQQVLKRRWWIILCILIPIPGVQLLLWLGFSIALLVSATSSGDRNPSHQTFADRMADAVVTRVS